MADSTIRLPAIYATAAILTAVLYCVRPGHSAPALAENSKSGDGPLCVQLKSELHETVDEVTLLSAVDRCPPNDVCTELRCRNNVYRGCLEVYGKEYNPYLHRQDMCQAYDPAQFAEIKNTDISLLMCDTDACNVRDTLSSARMSPPSKTPNLFCYRCSSDGDGDCNHPSADQLISCSGHQEPACIELSCGGTVIRDCVDAKFHSFNDTIGLCHTFTNRDYEISDISMTMCDSNACNNGPRAQKSISVYVLGFAIVGITFTALFALGLLLFVIIKVYSRFKKPGTESKNTQKGNCLPWERKKYDPLHSAVGS